jgi:hypothetical protein
MKILKKTIIVMFFATICVLFVAFSKSPYTGNPYTGKYESQSNMILELDNNNKCTIVKPLYKDAFYTAGKYTVDNDNNIKITFTDNDTNYFGKPFIEGKVEGSKIEFTSDGGNSIFLKQ